MAVVILGLMPLAESFQFEAKRIPLPLDSRVLLGSQDTDTPRDPPKHPSTSNGYIPSKRSATKGGEPITPLCLSPSHAEAWLRGNQVIFRDLESPFGTFVNDKKLGVEEISLKTGDIIRLGYQITRNQRTPSDITDDHLKPIIVKVTISVASHY
ncbi:hypothetical protein AMATHDRAFT_63324 [Amanita thiersii Skay4041]|uniref:FHA domain-containing protein n=1 Tax=Amanita thiersii Skay4041 TaxID=703135 RepID=A0A2A9NH31_9AGAR|nr:hypothetical protein AMATHDRAFT_63324 [Amanita thiersii Skay4041]